MAFLAHARILSMGLVLAVTAICAQKQSQQVSQDVHFELKYAQSGQHATEISVAGSKLTRVVTTCHNARPYDQNCANPTTDTGTLDLSAAKVEHLIGVIQASGFLQLKDVYGNTARGALSYPKSIVVTLGGATKKVEYRNGPGVPAPPQAFTAVEKEVINLTADLADSGSSAH